MSAKITAVQRQQRHDHTEPDEVNEHCEKNDENRGLSHEVKPKAATAIRTLFLQDIFSLYWDFRSRQAARSIQGFPFSTVVAAPFVLRRQD